MSGMRTLSARSRAISYPRADGLVRKMDRESRLEDRAWRDFESACQVFYGRDTGKEVFAGIRRGEHDFRSACEFLLGVKPFEWQVQVWDALIEHRYITGMLSNAGGKTEGYALWIMLSTFYKAFATPGWGQYRELHLAPQESQSLECKSKIDAILEDRSRAQMYRIPGGYDHRPCLLTPFFRAAKMDNGLHAGFEVIDEGYATITFRPTSFKAKGVDGTDPALVTWDELRHETNFDHVLNAIIMARFLRVPFGRLLMLFTPLEASVELVAAYNRGVSGLPEDIDWWSIALGLEEANPGISKETVDRAKRNIGKRYLPMVTGGKPIQPADSMFSQASVEACISGTTEPKWLDDLARARERMVDRCAICRAKGVHHTGEGDRRKHPAVAFLDPASSAAHDSTVGTILDLDPPDFPKHWYWVEYIEMLPDGTKIQRVGLHVALMSLVIHGPAGYDANSALGYNVKDEIAEFPSREDALDSKWLEPELRAALRNITLAAEPEIVPYDRNSKAEKDEDLAYFGGIVDMEKALIPFHLSTKSQVTNYVRADHGMKTDCVMTQVGAAWLAKYYLPDLNAERDRRRRARAAANANVPKIEGGDDPNYASLGFAVDPFFGLPDEASVAMSEQYAPGVVF